MNVKSNALHDLEGCFVHNVPEGCRRIAWDAVSFCVPSNWELAVYNFKRRGVSRVELEDEHSIRLESEWIRRRKKLNLKSIMQRYGEASKPLTLKAEQQNNVGGLPDGWHATHFVFRETGEDESGDNLEITPHELVTAFYLCPRASIFCFFILHFFPEDRQDAAAVIRQLANTFQDHSADAYVPWQLFEIGFKVPREFVLEKTHFNIGCHLFEAENRLVVWAYHYRNEDDLKRLPDASPQI